MQPEPTDGDPVAFAKPLTEAERIRWTCLGALDDLEHQIRRGATREELLKVIAGAIRRVEDQG